MPPPTTGPEKDKGTFASRLRATFRGGSKKETTQEFLEDDEEKRKIIIRDLEAIYDSIKKDTGDYADDHGLDLNNIKRLKLSLDEEPTPAPDTFFIPMTKEKLAQYPPDLTDEETKDNILNPGYLWDEDHYPDWLKKPKSASLITTRHSDALSLCNFLCQLFVETKRKDSKGGGQTRLRWVTEWNYGRYKGSLVDEKFSGDLFTSTIYSLSYPFEASKGRPHAMITIANGFVSLEKALYCYELLAILAVMISQFKKPSLKKHRVIPVKAISFSGWDGRILEAHYDSEMFRVVIKVSQLHDFSFAKVALPNLELFLRHMASEITGARRDFILVTGCG